MGIIINSKFFQHVILLIFLSVSIIAQEQKKSLFSSGDRVCFVGNSITNNGGFHHNVLLYQITRFPNQQVSFYNCGISGDVTNRVLKRLDDDILINKPTHAVIMLGMNDVNRSLYGKLPSLNADTLKWRTEAINKYKEELEKIIQQFLSKNIKVILQTPSIYDQTVVNLTSNNLGVNFALKTCSDFIKRISVKYKIPVVDYWTILNQLNQKIQKKDATSTIIGIDRVHPQATGHFVMAYQFLTTFNNPKYISKIKIDKRLKITMDINCEITDINLNQNVLTFTSKEKAIPFPIDSTLIKGLELVPFIRKLNDEFLQISGLKKGKYKLKIDSVYVDEFSSKQFENGVNLALYVQTPQYQQSLQVKKMLEDLWKLELKLREIKFIEYMDCFKSCPNNTNHSVVKSYLDSVFTVKYDNPFYKAVLNRYLTNKPSEGLYNDSLNAMRLDVYKLAQPQPHTFTITTELIK